MRRSMIGFFAALAGCSFSGTSAGDGDGDGDGDSDGGLVGMIAVDQLSDYDDDNEGCDCSWSHTVGTGEDRILVVSFGVLSPPASSAVRYGQLALTEIRTEIYPGERLASIWYLLAPPAGTDSITVTLPSGGRFIGAAASFTGVDQVEPIGVAVGAFAESTDAAADVTAGVSSVVVDFVYGGGNWDMIDATGRTERWEVNSGGERGTGSTLLAATTGVNTMGWSRGGSAKWVLVAAALRPGR